MILSKFQRKMSVGVPLRDIPDKPTNGVWICSCSGVNPKHETKCNSCLFPFPFDKCEEIEIIEEKINTKGNIDVIEVLDDSEDEIEFVEAISSKKKFYKP